MTASLRWAVRVGDRGWKAAPVDYRRDVHRWVRSQFGRSFDFGHVTAIEIWDPGIYGVGFTELRLRGPAWACSGHLKAEPPEPAEVKR